MFCNTDIERIDTFSSAENPAFFLFPGIIEPLNNGSLVMSLVFNDASTQQLSFFDFYNSLTEREKKFLEKSWAKSFGDHIFPKIDEAPYVVLYSSKDSRPNTPVNVRIGTLIIKEFMRLSDDELLTALMFDIRF